MSTPSIYFGRTPAGDPVQIELSALLGINKLLRGKPGSGKTQLLMRAFGQLASLRSHAIVIIDLGGDPVLFHHVKGKCDEAGVPFRFVSLNESDASFHFDLFQSARKVRNIARRANIIAAGLNLIYSEGYGSGHYTRTNVAVITRGVHRVDRRGAEFAVEVLFEEFEKMARGPARVKDAGEALFALQHLLYYSQLKPSEDPEKNVDIAQAIDRGECLYFYLPTLLEPLTARAIGAFVLWSVVVEAVQRKALGLPPRHIIIGIDEFPQIIGGKNVEAVLAQSRKYNCEIWAGFQATSQLVLRDADLRQIVTESASLRVYFSFPTKEDIDEVLNYCKTEIRTRKSTTARGYNSSVTMQENELPTFDANTLKEISGTFGHAIMLRNLGDRYWDPIHLICEPPLDKAEYDRLSILPLPQRPSPLVTPSPKKLLVRNEMLPPAEIARRVALRELLKVKRETLNGWRNQMNDEA